MAKEKLIYIDPVPAIEILRLVAQRTNETALKKLDIDMRIIEILLSYAEIDIKTFLKNTYKNSEQMLAIYNKFVRHLGNALFFQNIVENKESIKSNNDAMQYVDIYNESFFFCMKYKLVITDIWIRLMSKFYLKNAKMKNEWYIQDKMDMKRLSPFERFNSATIDYDNKRDFR